MYTRNLLASLGLLALARGSRPLDCGTNTEHAPDDFLKTIASLHDAPNSGSPAAHAAHAARGAIAGPITVDAVFHIVAKASSKASSKASITNAMPTAQLVALNKTYEPYDITFNLVNVTWNTHDAWAVDNKADDDNKRTLRQGSYTTLNIYFQTDLAGGVLGRCTLPSSIASNKADPATYFNDGYNVNANTMPSGFMAGYNSGMTAVTRLGTGWSASCLRGRQLRRAGRLH
jgi:hypothetical protein